MSDKTYTITDLAHEFKVTARAIRFYEDKGLLHPSRQGMMRVYTKRDRARLMLILRGKRVGFSLAEIREMIDLYDLGDGRVEQMKLTLKRSQERLAALEMQRRDIDTAISELKRDIRIIEDFLKMKERDRDNTPSFKEFVLSRTGTLANVAE
ncbi:MerR family DNA-binding transcriptional regulator [uncultured Ferrovibrio sp.]|uniref:MerR family transcriptional regulator n=1 Tax=uncultured Ferrovibrio sp. TaxID=1576913 RepID=UPI002633BAD7|nr:MerR family DNA-binding transcriptional regulator [uncultured Ferrovibrio sp.]